VVIFSHSDFIDFYFVTLVVTFSTYLLLERGEEEEEPIKQFFKSSTYKLRMFERTKKNHKLCVSIAPLYCFDKISKKTTL